MSNSSTTLLSILPSLSTNHSKHPTSWVWSTNKSWRHWGRASSNWVYQRANSNWGPIIARCNRWCLISITHSECHPLFNNRSNNSLSQLTNLTTSWRTIPTLRCFWSLRESTDSWRICRLGCIQRRLRTMWPRVPSTCPCRFRSKPCPTKNNFRITLTAATLAGRSRMRSRDSEEKTRSSNRVWSCPNRSNSLLRWINTVQGSPQCKSPPAPVERWVQGHRQWWGCYRLLTRINRTCITPVRSSTFKLLLEISVVVELQRFLRKIMKLQVTSTRMVIPQTSLEPALMRCWCPGTTLRSNNSFPRSLKSSKNKSSPSP